MGKQDYWTRESPLVLMEGTIISITQTSPQTRNFQPHEVQVLLLLFFYAFQESRGGTFQCGPESIRVELTLVSISGDLGGESLSNGS